MVQGLVAAVSLMFDTLRGARKSIESRRGTFARRVAPRGRISTRGARMGGLEADGRLGVDTLWAASYQQRVRNCRQRGMMGASPSCLDVARQPVALNGIK